MYIRLYASIIGGCLLFISGGWSMHVYDNTKALKLVNKQNEILIADLEMPVLHCRHF